MTERPDSDVWTRRINAMAKLATILTPVLVTGSIWLQNHSRHERKKQYDDIAQKQDTDLKNWHAYNTKEPEDVDKARAATTKAITKQNNKPN